MFSDELAIRVTNVSKRYELYKQPSDQLRQYVLPRLQRLLGIEKKQYFKDFWALRDLSFVLRKGESCGIVGLNGSGKSTLLQIITGTLTPTLGSVSIQGRIAALLELGSGFNPEFSGRDNVFMNGALLGFSRQVVKGKIDEIQLFADIGDHFDRPLTTYSSGMQMRLAFAVATSFDPDILIIDEALAVGDAYFQQKCFSRLEKFKSQGGTLLFVSHDANTVKHLCDKALLLNGGEVISFGAPKDVIDLYQGLVAIKTDLGEREVTVSQQVGASQVWKKATTVTTNDDAVLLDFKVMDESGGPLTYVESETPLVVEYVVQIGKNFDRPAFGLIIRDRLGRSIFETSTYSMRLPETAVKNGDRVVVRFTFDFNLRAGQYSFSVGVANRGFGRSEFEESSLLMHDVEQIQVVDSPAAIFYGGIFNMKPSVHINIQEPTPHG